MRTRPLLHQVAFHREEAVVVRRVKSSHGNLIATRDDRNQIRIRVGHYIIEDVVLLLGCAVARIVHLGLLGKVHAANILEGVLRQPSSVIVRSREVVRAGIVAHVITGDL